MCFEYQEAKKEARVLWSEGVLLVTEYRDIVKRLFRHYYLKRTFSPFKVEARPYKNSNSIFVSSMDSYKGM